jgi:hypothetical protein
MTQVNVERIFRSFFLSRREWMAERDGGVQDFWVAKPGMEELMNKFRRNKVILTFKTSDVGDPRGDGDDFKTLTHMVQRVCDKIATGFWTMDNQYLRETSWNTTTQRVDYHGTGRGQLEINFENEADLVQFLTKEALIIKLSN